MTRRTWRIIATLWENLQSWLARSELGICLCSNNLPIDIFGLYREVIKHGGFVDNERYDDYNRWTGGINFGGKASSRFDVALCLALHAVALCAFLRKRASCFLPFSSVSSPAVLCLQQVLNANLNLAPMKRARI